MHGYRFIYIPRTLNKLDRLFGEDILSTFEKKYDVAAWVETFDGYGPGGPDILSKFGLQVHDEMTIRISTIEFIEATGMKEPREGDLIYVPLNRDLLEIKWVEDEQQFYPLGQQMTFQLRLESFEYSMEKIQTGSDADNVDAHDLPDILNDYTPQQGDNKVIEDESSPSIDWSENNPFGEF